MISFLFFRFYPNYNIIFINLILFILIMVTLDQNTIKALASQTKLNILKSLSEKPRTLSELAKELNLKPSTVKEHLDTLESVALIEKEKTTRKWKYYYLTRKGYSIVKPAGKNFTLMLFSSLLFTILSGFLMLKRLISKPLQSAVMLNNETKFVMQNLNENLNARVLTQSQPTQSAFFDFFRNVDYSIYLFILFFTLFIILLICYLFRYYKYKKKVILHKN